MSTKYKVVIVGDSGVGKTCIARRATIKQYSEFTVPTIGGAHFSLSVDIDQKEVMLDIWDTAGQEEFRNIVPMFMRNAFYAIIVFDVTTVSSFSSVYSWAEFVKDNAPDCKIVLVGSKVDLASQRVVSLVEAMDIAKKSPFETFFETSSVTGIGIVELFDYIASNCSGTTVPQADVEICSEPVKKPGCC